MRLAKVRDEPRQAQNGFTLYITAPLKAALHALDLRILLPGRGSGFGAQDLAGIRLAFDAEKVVLIRRAGIAIKNRQHPALPKGNRELPRAWRPNHNCSSRNESRLTPCDCYFPTPKAVECNRLHRHMRILHPEPTRNPRPYGKQYFNLFQGRHPCLKDTESDVMMQYLQLQTISLTAEREGFEQLPAKFYFSIKCPYAR
jgi:hypothetical protein